MSAKLDGRPRFEATTKVDAAPLGARLDFPFSKRSAPNRFLNAAMSERLASYDKDDVTKSGIPSKELIRLYERWGQGGWGQVLTGNVQIHPHHLEAEGNAIIPSDAPFSGPRFEAFSELATKAKANGSLIVAQVSHPGRQVPDTIQKHPISASAVPMSKSTMVPMSFATPRAATREDIDAVIEGFAHAAEYLEKSGFDGMELHGAHGYLIAQFLSPTSNHRTDEYGGSLENRMRLVLEIASAIKKRVSSSFILGIKVNSVEFQDKGFTTDEAVILCQALEKAEFDYVETSGGTYESSGFKHAKESTIKRENFFIEWAAQIASALTKTKVYTTGGFKTVAAMVDALKEVDGVGIGRAACQEPDLVNAILKEGVQGILKFSLSEEQFLQRLMLSAYQIGQIGRDEEITDGSSHEATQEALAKIMAAHAAAAAPQG
ncbi:NADH oxidase [Xylariaceae sp. FL1272]|nr:NADH oxidase [Xylariaceae sp. FL1272]